MVGPSATTALAIRIASIGYAPDCVIVVYNSSDDVTGLATGPYRLRRAQLDDFIVPAYVPPKRTKGAYASLLPPPAHRASSPAPAPAAVCAWPAQMRRFRGDT